MVKTIIKELGIIILLLAAITLLLAIIFYDYIPKNKTVPIKIQAYSMPEDIKQELKDSIPENEENIIRTYYIDSADLNLYEATNDYDKGKPNPFAYYTPSIEENLDVTIHNNNTNSNTDNNTNTQNVEQNEEEVYITTPGKIY